ncbi:MAG: family 43 glycosylhydrolase, partial [Planctomycetales bacterium]|nr:family 43 glycosylhydrolase [Planctomycetales bacterium]
AEVTFQWSSDRQTGDGVFQPVPTANLLAAKRTSEQVANPLGPGADPFVTRWQGNYYMLNTTGGNVRMERAEKLEHIHSSDSQSSSLVVWDPPGGLSYSGQIWAPELHRLDGKWYIYVAASDGNNFNHRMHVLERDDADPFGQFVYKGQIATGNAGQGVGSWAIDGTVLTWQGTDYFIWSGWPNPVNPSNPEGTQNLYIAQMSNPWTITGPQVLISSATYSWELAAGGGGPRINEGPQVLVDDDHLHIIYSANGYWMKQYLLGRLTYNGVGSLLDASSWQKSPTPAFQQSGDIVGTGHASFTTSPDGTENWIVYHAHANSTVFQEDRVIHIQPFEFNANGAPDLGAPLPVTTPLPAPSGTPDAERPFVVGDFDADGEVDAQDLGVWQGQFGVTLIAGASADYDGSGLVTGQDFLAWQRSYAPPIVADPTVAYWRHEEGVSGGLIPAGPNRVVDSSGSGNDMQTFAPDFTSATYSTSVSPVPLRSGAANTLSLDFGPGGDDSGKNDDNYTVGKGIESEAFAALTVELAFNLNAVTGYQNLLGKDGKPTSSPVAPLQIKVRGDDFPNNVSNQLFVEWIDGDGDVHFLASGSSMTASTWNHVSFVLTATTAELYLAGESGEYQLVDATYGNDFAGPSGEVLIDSSGAFTVGRGMFNGNAADWSDALIDEVRISNAALQADEFLFAPVPAVGQSLLSSTSEPQPRGEIGWVALAGSSLAQARYGDRELTAWRDEAFSEFAKPPVDSSPLAPVQLPQSELSPVADLGEIRTALADDAGELPATDAELAFDGISSSRDGHPLR